MDDFIQLISSAGLSTSFVGICLFIVFTVQKQLAGVRAEQIATIERQKIEIKELSADKVLLNDKVDELMTTNGEHKTTIVGLKLKITELQYKYDELKIKYDSIKKTPEKEE